jgi:hypothetical protein
MRAHICTHQHIKIWAWMQVQSTFRVCVCVCVLVCVLCVCVCLCRGTAKVPRGRNVPMCEPLWGISVWGLKILVYPPWATRYRLRGRNAPMCDPPSPPWPAAPWNEIHIRSTLDMSTRNERLLARSTEKKKKTKHRRMWSGVCVCVCVRFPLANRYSLIHHDHL